MEYLIRLAHAYTLGEDCDTLVIGAVNFAQQVGMREKHVGYFACTVLMEPSHPLGIMLVNTMREDLKSIDPLRNALALSALPNLLLPEYCDPLMPFLKSKLTSMYGYVRRKAVTAAHALYLKEPQIISNMLPDVLKLFADKDVTVASAAVNLYHSVCKQSPDAYLPVASALAQLLAGILGGQVSREHEFKGVPCPWMQISILQTMAILGRNNETVSQALSSVLKDCLIASTRQTSTIALGKTKRKISSTDKNNISCPRRGN